MRWSQAVGQSCLEMHLGGSWEHHFDTCGGLRHRLWEAEVMTVKHSHDKDFDHQLIVHAGRKSRAPFSLLKCTISTMQCLTGLYIVPVAGAIRPSSSCTPSPRPSCPAVDLHQPSASPPDKAAACSSDLGPCSGNLCHAEAFGRDTFGSCT